MKRTENEVLRMAWHMSSARHGVGTATRGSVPLPAHISDDVDHAERANRIWRDGAGEVGVNRLV